MNNENTFLTPVIFLEKIWMFTSSLNQRIDHGEQLQNAGPPETSWHESKSFEKRNKVIEVGQRDTLLLIIRTHISPGTRVMSDMWKPYDCLKDEGYAHLTVNHNLNFVDRCAHPAQWKYTVGSQTKYASYRNIQRSFESYLQEWLWRQHYGDDPFAKTLSRILSTYMCKYRSSIVLLYALFVMWSPLHGGKKQNTQLQHMGLNWRKEIKRKKRPKTRWRYAIVLFHFSFHLKNHKNSRWPDQQFIAKRK